MSRPPIVTICGSTRCPAELAAAQRDLTFAGNLVFGVDVFGADLTAEEKQTLDDLHDAKILLSDSVYVVNPDGYLGKSTRREIAYAVQCGKPVHYLHQPSEVPV